MPTENTDIKLISTDQELQDLLRGEWNPLPPSLAFDLEADFDHYHYGKKLCLLQFYRDGKAWLIDPQGLQDLNPVIQLLENPDLEKVMYSGDGDVMLLKDVLGCRLRRIWDVQVAGKILGEEKIGMPYLVPRYLNREFPKNSRLQKSDWTLRPLSREQLDYAAGDVNLLPALKEAMEAALSPQQAKDMERRMKELEQAEFKDKPRPWETMKGAKRLPPDAKIRLKYLFYVREMAGEAADKPVFQILPHEALRDLAANPQTTAEDILRHRRAHRALKPLKEVLVYALRMAAIEVRESRRRKGRKISGPSGF